MPLRAAAGVEKVNLLANHTGAKGIVETTHHTVLVDILSEFISNYSMLF